MKVGSSEQLFDGAYSDTERSAGVAGPVWTSTTHCWLHRRWLQEGCYVPHLTGTVLAIVHEPASRGMSESHPINAPPQRPKNKEHMEHQGRPSPSSSALSPGSAPTVLPPTGSRYKHHLTVWVAYGRWTRLV